MSTPISNVNCFTAVSVKQFLSDCIGRATEQDMIMTDLIRTCKYHVDEHENLMQVRIERSTYLLNDFHNCLPFVCDVSPWCEISRELSLSYHFVDIIFVDSVFPFKRSENVSNLFATTHAIPASVSGMFFVCEVCPSRINKTEWSSRLTAYLNESVDQRSVHDVYAGVFRLKYSMCMLK